MRMSAAFLISALVQFTLGLIVAWLLGPAEFGVYALVVAASILLQTLVFEWIRLAATRFFAAGAGGLRKGLFAAFGVATLACLVLSGVAGAVTRSVLTLDRAAILLIPGLAIAAGFLELIAALLRARFREADYARILLVRNGLTLALVPLAAGLTGRAEFAGLALLASHVLAGWQAWRLERAGPDEPVAEGEHAEAAPSIPASLAYAGPVVLTNLLYLGLFFAMRSWAAFAGGLAFAGQVSLALDFTLKLFTTIGSALDLWLFQRAVQAQREQGDGAGQACLHRNAGIVLAVLLAMAIGLALVIEAFEPLLVRPDFRGAFAPAVLMLTPGVFLYAFIQYALHPYAQLVRRTWILVLTALAVVLPALAGGLLLAFLPLPAAFPGASGLAQVSGLAGLALVLAGAMALGCLVLARLSPGYKPPDGPYLGKLALALLAMAVPATLAQQQLGGLAGGITAALAGAAGFLLVAFLADLAGMRSRRLS